MNQQLHLDSETLRHLLSGDLPAEEARRWAEHLARDCAECEAVLAAEGPASALDGEADARLAGLAPVRDEELGNDLEYARIRRAMQGAPDRATQPRRRWAAMAVAAVALLGAGVVFQVTRAPRRDAEWTGEKGRANAAVPARLRFAVTGAGDVERGASGQVLPADASLLFRIEVGAPAHVALLRVGGGEREVIFRGQATRPGPVDVTVDGRPAAYPLHGLSGAQRFILVAGARPLTDESLAQAATFLGGQAASGAPRPPELTVDLVDITVK